MKLHLIITKAGKFVAVYGKFAAALQHVQSDPAGGLMRIDQAVDDLEPSQKIVFVLSGYGGQPKAYAKFELALADARNPEDLQRVLVQQYFLATDVPAGRTG